MRSADSVSIGSGARVGVLLVAMSLAACTAVGEKNFACPGRPPGVRCMSATEVYEATHASDVVAPTAPHALGSDPSRSKKSSRGKPERPTARESVEQMQTENRRPEALVPALDKPVPIRTPAQIMRAWIAPWEDAHGVAHSGEHIFIEIESRRWAFGDSMSTYEPARLFSIQSTLDAKESVGKDRSAAREASSGASERVKRNSPLPKEPSHVSQSSESHP